MNSRDKGKRGELEASHILNSFGFNTRRGQQYSGATGDADVIGIDGLHLEVKRVEKLNIYEAMEQSRFDARDGEVPVVMHRKNNKGWLVTLDLADFVALWKERDGKRAVQDNSEGA